jgi:outer membrane protein OmpA-like peptidoglycan-associated protein
MTITSRAVLAFGTIIGVAAFTPACATKKFVLGKIMPVEKRVEDLEATSAEHGEDIAENSRGVSRAEELAITAGGKADKAGEAAADAQRSADAAAMSAAEANVATGKNRDAMRDLATRLDRVHDLELVGQETILFQSGSSVLAPEAKAALDDFARTAPPDRPFIIEIQGFTDSTGSPTLNLNLSNRRADSVVRYLTSTHQVPLRSLHMLGLGEDQPTADNQTRDGRQQNRRVEVKMYSSKQTPIAQRVD